MLQKSLLRFCITFAVLSIALNITAQQSHDSNAHCIIGESNSSTTHIWFVGLISSLTFTFIGILPAFFVNTFENTTIFKSLLAFAAASLLGEVFFHFIPENFQHDSFTNQMNSLVIVASFFLFMIVDKVTDSLPETFIIINLCGNVLDNSAHGATVVGAFQSSFWSGMIALSATLLHEIPHEFGDFAMLLQRGLSRKKAIFAQIVTAFAGCFGSTLALIMSSGGAASLCTSSESISSLAIDPSNNSFVHAFNASSFISSLSTGGFLYIALVAIVPEMMEEKDKKVSIFQFISFFLGLALIFVMESIEHGFLL